MRYQPKSSLFKASEILISNFWMTLKMFLTLFFIFFIGHLILAGCLVRQHVTLEQFPNKTVFVVAYFESGFPQAKFSFDLGSGIQEMPASQAVEIIWNIWKPGINQIVHDFKVTTPVYLFIPFLIILLKRISVKENEKGHIRGPRLITLKELTRELKQRKEPLDLPIAGVKLPVSAEVQNGVLVGSPGTGKSTSLCQMLYQAIWRGANGIILDIKGEFTAKFFNPIRDFIFNPEDARCVRWTIFNEIKTLSDIDLICNSLIPDASHEVARFFNEAARNIFKSILLYIHLSNDPKLKTNREVFRILSLPNQELQKILQETDLGRSVVQTIQDPEGRQAQGILSTLQIHTRIFYYLARIDGPYSFKEWLTEGKGWVYLTCRPETRETFKPMLSLLIDMVGKSVFSLRDDPNRRIFFFLDEFGNLEKLTSLKDVLSMGRSKGTTVWLGCQSVSQIESVFGPHDAESILNNCATRLVFRVQSPKTAEYLEKAFGQREISEAEESHSMGPENMRDGLTLGRKKKLESIILASEFMSLSNFACYLKIQHLNPALTEVSRMFYSEKNEPFQMAPWLNLNEFKQEPPPVQEEKRPEAHDEEDPLNF
jgi:type IV secretory pathway TraG/TraD family ATPase VirD4